MKTVARIGVLRSVLLLILVVAAVPLPAHGEVDKGDPVYGLGGHPVYGRPVKESKFSKDFDFPKSPFAPAVGDGTKCTSLHDEAKRFSSCDAIAKFVPYQWLEAASRNLDRNKDARFCCNQESFRLAVQANCAWINEMKFRNEGWLAKESVSFLSACNRVRLLYGDTALMPGYLSQATPDTPPPSPVVSKTVEFTPFTTGLDTIDQPKTNLIYQSNSVLRGLEAANSGGRLNTKGHDLAPNFGRPPGFGPRPK